MKKIIHLGNLRFAPNSYTGAHLQDRVYSAKGISPTITANARKGTLPLIVVPDERK